ncbi:TolB family protein [Saccharospirillum mangrovi]|uniref:TolB family protein n=1 Tax=Saccharospirillum mangrovi TaxID=2161747 RepID=UPI000D3D8C17|nr:glycosyl transferase [Saccharospirillum mangrovi]
MSRYNLVERKLASLLVRYPLLKSTAKFLYARVVFLVNKKKYIRKSLYPLFGFDPASAGTFFGYYDKSPENTNGLVLACVTDHGTSSISYKSREIKIGVFDRQGNLHSLVSTKAFNLQQGARAHWLSENIFVYNDFCEVENRYVAKVFSVSAGKQIAKYDHPVQDSFKNIFFLSLNYRRLMSLRPDYGYRNLPTLSAVEIKDIKRDGLWYVDYKTGNSRLLVSIENACRLRSIPDFKIAFHKFNHVMISPSGDRAIFMHRYLIKGRRFDRLLSIDLKTSEMALLSDYGMVSHCYWLDNDTVLGYLRGPNGQDGYWLIQVSSGRFSLSPTEALKSYGDGHPHVNGDWFVTDTYPDKSRMQHLLLANWKTGEVRHLGEFYHPFRYSGESRCDLHPRFSPDGKSVYFDSVWSGERHLYRMDLDL